MSDRSWLRAWWPWLVLGLIVVIILWLSVPWWFPSKKLKEMGQYGDQYGSLNALFSGLALACIFVTLLFQSMELKLQRKEIENNRQVLEAQQREMKSQAESLRRRNLNDEYLLGLRQLQDIRNALRKEGLQDSADMQGGVRKPIEGWQFLLSAWEALGLSWNREKDLKRAYDDFWYTKDFGTTLDPYFRTLDVLFSMAWKAGKEDRGFMVDFLLASLRVEDASTYRYHLIQRGGLAVEEKAWILDHLGKLHLKFLDPSHRGVTGF